MPTPESEKELKTQELALSHGPIQSLMLASKSFTYKYGSKYVPEFSNKTLNSAIETATNLTNTVVGKVDCVACIMDKQLMNAQEKLKS